MEAPAAAHDPPSCMVGMAGVSEEGLRTMGESVKVLVVDDDPSARQSIWVILEEFGYHCRQAEDGQDALDQFGKEPADLVVTDLDMPRLDGLSLVERIRSGYPNLPIIVVTSRADFKTGQEALKRGVADYLVKPIDDPAEVRAAARRAVQNAGERDVFEGLAWELERKANESPDRPSKPDPLVHFDEVPRIRGYEIEEEVGKGGVGTVYRAVQVATQRTVALKVLAFSAGTHQSVASLAREVYVAQRLRHPNLIRGYDSGVSGGYFYVAMEYVDGKTLGELVTTCGPMLEGPAMEVAGQIASALAHAWEIGLVHRDVKPQNIILTRQGKAKLADLGISRDVTGQLNTLSSEGHVVGTPLYMSPEQAHGAKSADWRADVYGLGATLYHLVTGFTPFDAKLRAMALMFKHAQEDPPPAHIRNTEVSLQVSQLIERMMQKKCEDRHVSPDELLADIEQAKHAFSFEFASG